MNQATQSNIARSETIAEANTNKPFPNLKNGWNETTLSPLAGSEMIAEAKTNKPFPNLENGWNETTQSPIASSETIAEANTTNDTSPFLNGHEIESKNYLEEFQIGMQKLAPFECLRFGFRILRLELNKTWDSPRSGYAAKCSSLASVFF